MPPNEQEALSADIHLLGDLLGQTIRRLEGEEIYALVEEVRASAKRLRSTPSLEEARRLRDRLEHVDLRSLRALTRAFSVYFDLINLAEQRARVRALRARALRGETKANAETPEAAFRQLRDRGIDADQVAKHLGRALLCPVFTAHPSEARRRTVLEKINAVGQLLDRIEYDRAGLQEVRDLIGVIAEEVEALWLSDTIRSTRPSVIDEVRQGLRLVEESLFDVVPRVYRKIETGLARVYPEGQPWVVPPFLAFGSWIGGDRDGHPNVTHTVTADAVRLQQEEILNHYLVRMDDLWRRLSHSDRFVKPGAALRASLKADEALFPEVPKSPAHEPYRAKCRMISEKLRRTVEHARAGNADWAVTRPETPPGVYLGRAELLADLRLIADDLRRAGAEAAASGALKDMIRLVEVFGVHLLTLDLRQHSGRHTEALDEVFAAAGVCDDYEGLSPDERFDLLARELEQTRPLIPAHLAFSAEANEVIETFRTMAAILEQQCPEALRIYIISSTTEPAHLLEVLLLAREARLFRPAEGVSMIDVAPLFEASEPLKEGAAIMARLFDLPVYRNHLALRGDLQEVMIGYSDSSKEAGMLKSSWFLQRAQRELAELGRKTGLTMQFFHGRGGSVGRGGGPANRAILAQPRDTVDGRFRTTEQGEVIADRYGHKAIAERHLEQVVNAVLRSSFHDDAEEPDPAWVPVLDRLSEAASRHYRALVYETPEFLAYFEQATPIKEISQLKLGSRPARRGAASGIEQLRAIPWVFSWMQSRHTLPGWYGLGGALADYLADDPGGLDLLRDMYRRWPFWSTLVDNAQMILAKADMTIARLYADLADDQAAASRVFDRIAAEYERTADVINRIVGQSELLENSPILRRSIQNRNPYVDPLSFLQLVFLKQLRAAADPPDDLVTCVLESISGIASGLKNTGWRAGPRRRRFERRTGRRVPRFRNGSRVRRTARAKSVASWTWKDDG